MLAKAVQLLGVNCGPDHIEHGQPISGPHVFIKRDPRNVVVSWLRFTGKPVTQGMFISALGDFYQERTLVDSFSRYEGWLDDWGTLVTSFEALQSKAELVRIAEYIGVPYLEDAYPALPGGTFSWTGKHSDYRDVWTPLVQKAWKDVGGDALMKRWGY